MQPSNFLVPKLGGPSCLWGWSGEGEEEGGSGEPGLGSSPPLPSRAVGFRTSFVWLLRCVRKGEKDLARTLHPGGGGGLAANPWGGNGGQPLRLSPALFTHPTFWQLFLDGAAGRAQITAQKSVCTGLDAG